ncbi:MAG: hypothetical protein FJ272_04845, partial [Planctomycetes bacterium]|nr:hypothetical protein [Planctomycetota bacterium]
MTRRSILGLCLALVCGVVLAQPQRHDRVFVVPAPAAVTVDGDLREWDLTGAIEGVFEESLRPKFTVRLALMHDAQALYVSARFVDDTPMLNRHDPDVEPNQGWAADSLQMRLCSDPTATYPLVRSNSDRICHLTMWFFSDRQLPVLQMQYGMDYHGTKLWTGAESGLAFRKDGDGYTLEARIPWERLNAATNPPKAGDRLALVLQPLWSDSSGSKQVLTFNEVIRAAGFSFQNVGMWGQAIFVEKGQLLPAERPSTPAEQLQPLSLALPVPDSEAKSLSAAVYDAQGDLVRTLPVTVSGSAFRIPHSALRWDGLDDDGRPLAPGRYTVKTLSHRGVGQKYVTSIHNPGNPPWRTDDARGAWGGDHGPAIAATADAKQVYLGWVISEAGTAVIALDTAFTADGKVQKRWGQHQVLEIGIVVTA